MEDIKGIYETIIGFLIVLIIIISIAFGLIGLSNLLKGSGGLNPNDCQSSIKIGSENLINKNCKFEDNHIYDYETGEMVL